MEKKDMKKILAVALSALVVTGTTQVFAADTNATAGQQSGVVFVNVQQLFQQSPKIAELNKSLQNKFKPRQDKLASQQKDLQDEVEKFKKDSSTMSQKDKDALQKKIMADQSGLAKEYTNFQQDLQKEQNKVMTTVLKELNDVIGSVAKNSHYNFVLDSQAVIYADQGTDITKQVAKEFDKK